MNITAFCHYFFYTFQAKYLRRNLSQNRNFTYSTKPMLHILNRRVQYASVKSSCARSSLILARKIKYSLSIQYLTLHRNVMEICIPFFFLHKFLIWQTYKIYNCKIFHSKHRCDPVKALTIFCGFCTTSFYKQSNIYV